MMKYLTAALCALLAGLSAPPASAGPAAAAADPLESARSAEIRASIEQCRSDRLEALLDAGADPNVFMENGDTAFTYAMRTDCVRCADLLMKAKTFRVNAANRFGETPLMLAVFKGNEEIFEALLRAGADPKAQPKSWTALHYAATEGREDFVKRLLEPLYVKLSFQRIAYGHEPVAFRDKNMTVHLKRTPRRNGQSFRGKVMNNNILFNYSITPKQFYRHLFAWFSN